MTEYSSFVNNAANAAVQRNTGFILGETPAIPGYGQVQWNLRNSGGAQSFSIPFGTSDSSFIPYVARMVLGGTQTSDSGFIVVATYPTNANVLPSNRPLPAGVSHLNNLYGIENGPQAVDRFWMVDYRGYLSTPRIDAQYNLTNARAILVNASAEILIARAKLLATMGIIGE